MTVKCVRCQFVIFLFSLLQFLIIFFVHFRHILIVETYIGTYIVYLTCYCRALNRGFDN